jgi:hypothetical protein
VHWSQLSWQLASIQAGFASHSPEDAHPMQLVVESAHVVSATAAAVGAAVTSAAGAAVTSAAETHWPQLSWQLASIQAGFASHSPEDAHPMQLVVESAHVVSATAAGPGQDTSKRAFDSPQCSPHLKYLVSPGCAESSSAEYLTLW